MEFLQRFRVLLQISQCEPVKWRMGGDTVDDSCCVPGVDEPAGQYQKLFFFDGGCEAFSNDLSALEPFNNFDLSCLLLQFFGGNCADCPHFVVYPRLYVVCIWVYPHVCHTEYRLRPEGGGR